MSFLEDQRRKVVLHRDQLFNDPGGGIYRGKPREFVLAEPILNLWDGIRDDAIAYFNRNQIPWWMGGKENLPTGHLLSSQVACVNHLFWLRENQEAASQILKGISADFKAAVIVDDGFVEFEVIGEQNYLGERSHSRGANATSIDAVMVGKKISGEKTLVMIEWKYTEHYPVGDSKYIPARSQIYDSLLAEADCPIQVDEFEALYFEPFYQLTRQTLLGWQMVKAGEYGCSDYLHLHVIPKDNLDLRDRVTSPGLPGKAMSEAWKAILKSSRRYRVVTPEKLLEPTKSTRDTKSIHDYLSQRYEN
ncbi:MAG TPA: hypothetical protein ENF22_09365 [Chloroflexi bacterium]|nr:hypothetical protein [Chloroflexota bacterium]